MSKTVHGFTTKFVWDGMNMILEHVDYFNNTGYYYGPGGVEFQQYSDGMHLAAAYVKNALGDVVGTYDVMSGVTLYREYCYDAYGNAVEEYDNTNAMPPSENPFRYRGEYYDAETGLYYLRNRYYDPKAGRFITEDPIRDGTNWYTYCAGNPVMFRDPTGFTYENGVWLDDVFYYMKDGTYYGYIIGERLSGDMLVIVDKHGIEYRINPNNIDHQIIITEDGTQYYAGHGQFYTLDGRDKITAANIEYDDYDDSYDDYYDQNKNDRMRGRDAKRREKKRLMML